jgi:hypothetical protein
MKLSSFIMLTAAGLAVAAPISPYASDDMSLTVEPAEVVKRQDNNLGALNTVTSTTESLPGLSKRGTLKSLPLVGGTAGGLPIAGTLKSKRGKSDKKGKKAPKAPKGPLDGLPLVGGLVGKREGNNLEPLNTVTSTTKTLPIVGKRG